MQKTAQQHVQDIALASLHLLFSVFVLLSSIWLCAALWIQEPLGWLISRLLIGAWIAFSLSVLGIYISQHFFSRRADVILYIFGFLCALFWYFQLPAKLDRDWNPEVAEVLSYEKQGDLVTLHNVRNFNWHSSEKFDAHWETRRYDLNKITGVNIITSYWMGPQIAHTLVSFDFADAKPLTFSIEIRKEKGEDFSAIGGFFRKYELSLVASDEKDLIYTRSNIRGEQVYFFPVNMPKTEMKALFIQYLSKADDLAAEARWYNTLTSNCTTLVFDMVQAVSSHQLPTDYRLFASGYLPNYLYDLGALEQNIDMQTWYDKAHINPKVLLPHPISSQEYSKRIRADVPKADPQFRAEKI